MRSGDLFMLLQSKQNVNLKGKPRKKKADLLEYRKNVATDMIIDAK